MGGPQEGGVRDLPWVAPAKRTALPGSPGDSERWSMALPKETAGFAPPEILVV